MLLFSNVLESRKTHGLRWEFHYYPDDNHGSVTMIATYDAFRFFFNKLGDYYLGVNDKENAILFFTKALELKEVPVTRNKLNKLKN